jgi:hypothetical protein
VGSVYEAVEAWLGLQATGRWSIGGTMAESDGEGWAGEGNERVQRSEVR